VPGAVIASGGAPTRVSRLQLTFHGSPFAFQQECRQTLTSAGTHLEEPAARIVPYRNFSSPSFTGRGATSRTRTGSVSLAAIDTEDMAGDE
jgi:hypothetical protein